MDSEFYQQRGEHQSQSRYGSDFFYQQGMSSSKREYNPFDDRYESEQEKMRRKAKRDKWRAENIIREADEMKSNVAKFSRVRERAVIARAIRVSDVLAKSFLSSPMLILIDISAVGCLVGSFAYVFT